MRAVNLLPRDLAKRPRKRPTVVLQLAIVSPLVVGSVIAAGYLLVSSSVNGKKATLRTLQDELAALPAPAAPGEADAGLVAERNERITALASALQARVAWDRILREISTVLPEDVWLTTLSAQGSSTPPPPPPTTTTTDTTTTTTETTTTETTTTTPAPAAPTFATVPLSLAGFTYSQEGVARFLTRLAVIPELQDVKLLQSSQEEIAGRNVVSFSIEAAVRKQAT